MQEWFETVQEDHNPIDNVEEVLNAHNWTFSRPTNEELMLEVQGKYGKYNLFFIWQEEFNALQFGCHYDITVSPENMDNAHSALLSMNEHLWMGHFDLPNETRTPIFRYTCMLRAASMSGASEMIEDIVDAALMQCERYYSVFKLFNEDHVTLNESNVSLALMETVGRS